jgi:hypothetical protein
MSKDWVWVYSFAKTLLKDIRGGFGQLLRVKGVNSIFHFQNQRAMRNRKAAS